MTHCWPFQASPHLNAGQIQKLLSYKKRNSASTFLQFFNEAKPSSRTRGAVGLELCTPCESPVRGRECPWSGRWLARCSRTNYNEIAPLYTRLVLRSRTRSISSESSPRIVTGIWTIPIHICTLRDRGMRNRIGNRSHAAAMFVYLADHNRDTVWRRVRRIQTKEGPICGERYRDKQEFLDALRDWTARSDPENSYLCICAHAGKPGISCVPRPDRRLITWNELAKAIVRPVRYLWLVGCHTDQCLKHWDALSGPVGRILMATTDLAPPKLVRFFAHEISINSIVSDGEMPELLQSKAPDLAKITAFFEPRKDRRGFVKAFQSRSKAGDD